jgi:hypothetical protein
MGAFEKERLEEEQNVPSPDELVVCGFGPELKIIRYRNDKTNIPQLPVQVIRSLSKTILGKSILQRKNLILEPIARDLFQTAGQKARELLLQVQSMGNQIFCTDCPIQRACTIQRMITASELEMAILLWQNRKINYLSQEGNEIETAPDYD